MKRVTGIGGIFFKSDDPQKMNDWYKRHLGMDTSEYGTSFEWIERSDVNKTGMTQWATFDDSTDYFNPSSKDFMINYRVENLEALAEMLKNEGVVILDEIETYDYGKFLHILDIEGNKIELWEPIDEPSNKTESTEIKP